VLDSGALAPGFATDTYIVPSLIADVAAKDVQMAEFGVYGKADR